MTILITGGTGFLGSYLTRYAVEQGARVVLLDRYPERGRIADVLDRVTLIEGDVADADLMFRVIADHTVERIAHFGVTPSKLRKQARAGSDDPGSELL